MCEACKKKGALECPHNQHEIPHWKRDKKRGKLVQSIMSTDKTMYLRENAGVVAKQENNAFSLDGVDILSSSTFEFHSAIDIKAPVFTCIDTAGGGSSCTAVCTGIFTPSHSLVVRFTCSRKKTSCRRRRKPCWGTCCRTRFYIFLLLRACASRT